MTVHRYVKIGGTDYGPEGSAYVQDFSLEVAGKNRVGSGQIKMVVDETVLPAILMGQQVQVYKTDSGTGKAFGWLGGVVVNKRYKILKMDTARVNKVYLTIDVQDLNLALDTVVHTAAPVSMITVPADTLANQVTYLVTHMQNNGFAGVQWAINTVDYVINLTGATVLPAFTILGESLRQGMDKIVANVYLANSAIRMGYHVALMSDGIGGVEAAMRVYDQAAPPAHTFVIAANPSGGEYPIYDMEDVLNGSKIVNKMQVRYGDPLIQLVSYSDATSQATYPNPWVNDGGAASTGNWWALPYTDKDSATLAEATAKLEQKVKPVQNPIQTITLTVDNIDIAPGDVATIRIPEMSINSDFQAVSVKVKLIDTPSQTVYSRSTITFGKRKRELFDTGEDGEAGPPDDPLHPPAPLPPTALVLDTTWGVAGWMYGERGYATPRFSFTPPVHAPRQYHIEISQGNQVIEGFDIDGVYTKFTPSAENIGETYTYNIWSKNDVLSDTSATLGPLTVPSVGNSALVNPGFEAVDNGVAGGIRGWDIITVSGGTATLDSANPHSGNYAVKLLTTATIFSQGAVTSKLVSVFASQYAFKFWGKGSTTNSVSWTVDFFAADGVTNLGTATGTQALTTSYALYSFIPIQPANTAYYRLKFANITVSRTVWIDDVSVSAQIIAVDVSAGAVAFAGLDTTVVNSIPGGSLGTGLITSASDSSLSVSHTNKLFVPPGSLTDNGGGVVSLDFDVPTITPIVATNTFSNSTAENTLYSLSALPTNRINAAGGTIAPSFNLRAFGRISNAATGHTTTIRVKVGGVTVFTVAVPTITGANAPWSLDFTFTIRTSGVSGTAWAYLTPLFNNIGTPQTSTATFTVNTTGSVSLAITEQFSALSASDTISIDQAIVQ